MRDCAIWTPKGVHLLIDPDKWKENELENIFSQVPNCVSSLIVGGTFIHTDRFAAAMRTCLKTGLPTGNVLSAGYLDSILSPEASHLLIPVTLGSHNSRFITDHIIRAAPTISHYGLNCTSYAYLMIDGGIPTSTEYFTQMIPIPKGKPEILQTMALTAKYLGLDGIYLEAGSGARAPVSPAEVYKVASVSDLPILVGGGIRNADLCTELFDAGAVGVVIGTAMEESRNLDWLEKI